MHEKNIPLSPLSPFRDVLMYPGFRHLWFGQMTSQLALNTLLFVLGIRVYETTGSNTAVSAIFLVYGIAAVIFGMAGGTIVDRLDKRFVLVACDFSRALIVFLFFFFSHNIFLVYFLTLLNAVITQLYVPAEAPTIPRLVPEKHLVTANSLFSFTYFTSLAVGSIFAGPFLRLFGPTGVFFSLAVLFLIACFHVWHVPKELRTRDVFAKIRFMSVRYMVHRLFSNTLEGLAYVFRSKALRQSLLLLTGTQVILAVLGSLGPGFADKVLQIDIRDSSLIVTGPVVIGIILGALWVGSAGVNFSSTWLIQRGVLFAGTLLLAISILVRLKRVPVIAPFLDEGVHLVIILILFFFLGVANSLLDVPSNSILQQNTEGKLRGRVYGILTASVGGVGILPVFLGGLLADTIGVGKVIFAMGLFITVYGIFNLRYNRSH